MRFPPSVLDEIRARLPVSQVVSRKVALKRAGRDPDSAPVSLCFAPPKPEALDALAAAGVARAIFGLPSAPRDAILPRLDGYAKLIR